MAYLPADDGKVEKRVLLRKGFWDDHFEELSAIVRGESRKLLSPVSGWRRRKPLKRGKRMRGQDDGDR